MNARRRTMPRRSPRASACGPRRHLRGVSLVEASLAVALVGSVLAVFLPVFFRELRTSRIAEAPEQLAELSARSAAYFGARVGGERSCLPPETEMAPGAPSSVAQEVDFSAEQTPGHETWSALEFQPPRPIFFSYQFVPTRAGCGLTDEPVEVVLRAYGDLDGDGRLSTFERLASTESEDGSLTSRGALHVTDRTE